jgi:hypothetical protein
MSLSERKAPHVEPKEPRTAPSWQGKKGLVVYVSPAAAKEIRLLALDKGSSIQELGVENTGASK